MHPGYCVIDLPITVWCPVEIHLLILLFFDLKYYIIYRYKLSKALSVLFVDRADKERYRSRLNLSLSYPRPLHHMIRLGRRGIKHPVSKLSIRLQDSVRPGRFGLHWSPLLLLPLKHLNLKGVTRHVFSDFLCVEDTRSAGLTVETLTWEVALAKDFSSTRGNISFFRNLKVLELKGNVSEIHPLLNSTHWSCIMQRVKIDVYGAVGGTVPIDFYLTLPNVLLHLYPEAETRINSPDELVVEHQYPGYEPSVHLAGECYCAFLFPRGSLSRCIL